MFKELIYIFSFPFMQNALIVGLLISVCSSLLGVSLVLKKYSMIGDGLSHIGFGALALAAALGLAPLSVAVPIVVISAFLLLRISENNKLRGDSIIAVISTSALAIGVFIVSKSGANTDLSNYLFGSILAISKSDTVISIVLSVIVILLFIAFYPRIFSVTFDEAFAKATGTKVGLFNALISVLTALTVVIGMRLMGSLLISSLIIFPPLSAMRLFKTFKKVTFCSSVISVICFLAGLFSSYYLNAPTGACIVIFHLLTLLICFALRRIIDKIKRTNQN